MLKKNPLTRIVSACAVSMAALTIFTFSAADARAAKIDATKIPKTAARTTDFIPAGWMLEEQLKGDVTGDGNPEFLMTVMEEKPASMKEDDIYEKDRALIIVSRDDEGKLSLVGVGANALQCGGCGGAFYGVIEAPASVTISNTGTIVLGQESGSNTVSESTITLRWDAAAKKFMLIGYDYAYRDRTNGDYATESINYVTGDRVVKQGKGKKDTTAKTKVTKSKTYLETVDYSKLMEDSNKRLGLD